MSTQKELFNKLTKDLGGLLDTKSTKDNIDIDSPPEQILGYGLDLFRNNLRKLQLSDEEPISFGIENIEVYYVNNSNLNAYAIRDYLTGSEFIGLNYGTSKIVQSYFSLLLSTKELFPQIGESSNESYKLKEIIPDLQNLDGKLFGKTSPKDEKRKMFAFGLWHIAMDFLFFHELGHHVQGHLLLFEELNNNSIISECLNSTSGTNKEFYSLSQILETDADSFSMIVSSLSANQIYEFLNLKQFGYTVNEFRFLACYFLFHIFDESNIDNSLGRTRTHPHPAIRIVNILYFMVTMTARTQSQFENEISKYSKHVDIIELTLNIISKYPNYKRRTKERSVVETARSLRLDLGKLLDEKLKKLKKDRLKNFRKESSS